MLLLFGAVWLVVGCMKEMTKPNYLPKVQRLASGASSTGRTITNLKQKEYGKELFYPD